MVGFSVLRMSERQIPCRSRGEKKKVVALASLFLVQDRIDFSTNSHCFSFYSNFSVYKVLFTVQCLTFFLVSETLIIPGCSRGGCVPFLRFFHSSRCSRAVRTVGGATSCLGTALMGAAIGSSRRGSVRTVCMKEASKEYIQNLAPQLKLENEVGEQAPPGQYKAAVLLLVTS